MSRTILTASIAALLALVLGSGCAQNGIFELQIELPPAPAGEEWYAFVQVRDQTGDFSLPWQGNELPSVRLGDARAWDCISVNSTDPSQSLKVRVRFCHSPDCLDLEDGNPPERFYEIETPFYIGARTYYRLSIDEIPACTGSTGCDATPGVCFDGQRCGCNVDSDCGSDPTVSCLPGVGCVEAIGRCSVEGCIDGPVAATFCSMRTGEHFCERDPDIRRDDTFQCSGP